MIRRIRLFGLEVLSIETYDEPEAEAELTAGDNGGETRSERIDVTPLGFRPMGDGEWEDSK